ncbi:MAG: glycosyltransferase, partial [Candidatus Eremiobacteraeota bacterium]|nr:glycosyltransferase [Candidatus Eremiobacteraeota bacterium]
PDTLHVCYCHSPLRYAWDLQHAYLRESGLGWSASGVLARWLLHRLRLWDARSSLGVDQFVANSQFIARRIAKAYRRPAAVVYPPVDTAAFTPGAPDTSGGAPDGGGPYYVTASRFVPYKQVPTIVEAFRGLPDHRLVVIGDGPQRRAAERVAGRNVTFLGEQSFEDLRAWLRGARAFVFAAVEDFGIAPIEAQACGTPVIAYAGGALPETVPGLGASEPCGVLYDAQTPAGVAAGVRTFEANAHRITAAACRRNAERYAIPVFRAAMGELLAEAYAAHRANIGG